MCVGYPFIFCGKGEKKEAATQTTVQPDVRSIILILKSGPRSAISNDVSAFLTGNRITLSLSSCYKNAFFLIEDVNGNQMCKRNIDASLSEHFIDVSFLLSGERYLLKIQNGLYSWEGEFEL